MSRRTRWGLAGLIAVLLCAARPGAASADVWLQCSKNADGTYNYKKISCGVGGLQEISTARLEFRVGDTTERLVVIDTVDPVLLDAIRAELGQIMARAAAAPAGAGDQRVQLVLRDADGMLLLGRELAAAPGTLSTLRAAIAGAASQLVHNGLARDSNPPIADGDCTQCLHCKSCGLSGCTGCSCVKCPGPGIVLD